ncbi:KEOPS complex subunit Cgi121 [Halovenus rubra]|uniref:KEOPS complex subunit Cgi121 n=2 Tax=Halovenus rubra TaxID=869890 RepID=A0ABD5XBJ2_9EURY|nr:KEOPS complex subunit Cgi121 [Halovenus rubra]
MQVIEGIVQLSDVEQFVERLDEVADDHDSTVQAFDARYVVDRTHLKRAVETARRERERGNEIARDPGVEILLYAAGRRQIQDALEMGVSEGKNRVVIVVVGGDEQAAVSALEEIVEPAKTLGTYDPEIVQSFFDVSEKEQAATDGTLAASVRERVGLLVVDR